MKKMSFQRYCGLISAGFLTSGIFFISAQIHAATLDDDIINVMTYGAKGDGVTDDTAAINAAAKAQADTFRGVKAPSGLYVVRAKELYFPSGHYLLNGQINITSAAANIRSEAGATLNQKANSPILVVANGGGGSAKVKIQGLQFIGGTNQVIFTNDNINGTMLKIED